MFDRLATSWFRSLGKPCLRVYGKAQSERDWRIVEIHATHRRDLDSTWPAFLFRGACITWTSQIVAVGWDFAETVLREQIDRPASREFPVSVLSGRLNDPERRRNQNFPGWASCSELMAHECGHTAQARRMGGLYWLIGAGFTRCREGYRWWNHFENQASEEGVFGGIVRGSVCERLRSSLW